MDRVKSELFAVETEGGVALSGTLARPDGACRGTIALVSGSGPQDRDESIAGVRPFAVLRRALTEAGFAVCSWDDRGVGASGGDYLASDPEEVIADVTAVLAFVRDATSSPLILVAGHSQGALVAAEVAARSAEPDGGFAPLAGVLLLAGAFRPGRQVLESQHRRICEAEGWSRTEIDESLAFKSECFDVLEQLPPAASVEETERLRAALVAIVERWAVPQEDRGYVVDDLMEWEWRYLLRYDPAAALARVPCPALVLAGDLDTQIDAARDVAEARRILEGGRCPHVTATIVPGLNHLFQHVSDGRPGAYASGGTPFHPRSIREITTWLDGIADR